MTVPPSEIPSSFDPAIYLHSEGPAIDPPSESFSDELEALNLQHLEDIRNKVVIQHRAWNLSDVFRSDEDITPITPTRSNNIYQGMFPSSPPVADMPFISSPAAILQHIHSSAEHRKRKSENQEPMLAPTEPQKRQKITGGFVDDEEEEEEGEEIDNETDMKIFEDVYPSGRSDIQNPGEHISFTAPLNTDLPGRATGPALVTRPHYSMSQTVESSAISKVPLKAIHIKTCSGKIHYLPQTVSKTKVSYERLAASLSAPAPGKAQRSYYGIEVHKLIDEAIRHKESPGPPIPLYRPTIQQFDKPSMAGYSRKFASAMWTEKYRAKKFTDLIGDERTHRAVLRWLKGWDPIVFPSLTRSKCKEPDIHHKKILLLSGPPGLGKTTLAHVCARQAGYETLEINASDERSRDVVKGRIKNALGTENVNTNVDGPGAGARKVGRPVCVVVDEADGVVSGSASGEGGFMKALVDLAHLDGKRATQASGQPSFRSRVKKVDSFRFLRPLILICNDAYHPSLRPLRSSSVAEVIHVRQAPLESVVRRLKDILEREGIPSDIDAVRKLCEASWGLPGRRQSSRGSGAEGDIRNVLVSAEWVAHKFRSENPLATKLTRTWLEQKVLGDDSFSKSMSRGGVRDIVRRVFTEGAGFCDSSAGLGSLIDQPPESIAALGFSDMKKRHAIIKLQEMVDASGEHDRCVTDCFASYPEQIYQDDTLLSKPNAAYDWLHFHDTVSSKVFSNQDWELMPYLNQSVAAFHSLFASTSSKSHAPEKGTGEEDDEHPFSGPRADFAAFEAQKQNRTVVTEFQSSLSAPLARLFRSAESLAIDLVPNLLRMLSPNVKPVLLRGNGGESVASVRKGRERALIQSAARVMIGLGVRFELVRVENEGSHGGWAYRMQPPLDRLVEFSKVKGSEPVRYATRKALDQEYRKETARKQSETLSSYRLQKADTKPAALSEHHCNAAKNVGSVVKRDFFGRLIHEPTQAASDPNKDREAKNIAPGVRTKVWVTFHDGFSNAVRRPISMSELLTGL